MPEHYDDKQSATERRELINRTRERMCTWRNRATMAEQQGNADLRQIAIDRADEYQRQLIALGDDDSSSGPGTLGAPVPRRPYPPDNSSSNELSVAEKKEEE